MKGNKTGFWTIIAVAALVCLTAGIVSAASSATSITYQGKLADADGKPLTGTYPVTFSLYDSASGGSALATDSHSVTAADGIFTTAITFDPSLYDGRGLWLGIRVGSDPEMRPLQEIRPVPYAMAVLGSSSDPITAIVRDIQTKTDLLVTGLTALQTDVTAIRNTVESRRKPIRYEYYTGTIDVMQSDSYMSIDKLTNYGPTSASACYDKYYRTGGSSNPWIDRSYCIDIPSGATRSATPQIIVSSSSEYRVTFNSTSEYVTPQSVFMYTNGDIIYTYNPGDFQKIEVYG